MIDQAAITKAVDALLTAEPCLAENFSRSELRELVRVFCKRLVICGRVERQERDACDG